MQEKHFHFFWSETTVDWVDFLLYDRMSAVTAIAEMTANECGENTMMIIIIVESDAHTPYFTVYFLILGALYRPSPDNAQQYYQQQQQQAQQQRPYNPDCNSCHSEFEDQRQLLLNQQQHQHHQAARSASNSLRRGPDGHGKVKRTGFSTQWMELFLCLLLQPWFD